MYSRPKAWSFGQKPKRKGQKGWNTGGPGPEAQTLGSGQKVLFLSHTGMPPRKYHCGRGTTQSRPDDSVSWCSLAFIICHHRTGIMGTRMKKNCRLLAKMEV